jgi:ribosomal protein L32
MLKKCDKCGKAFETKIDHLLCHDCWMSEIEKIGGMTDDA